MYGKPKRVRNLYGVGKKPSKLKIKKQSEDKIIKNMRNLFKLKKENEKIKDTIIRNTKKLLEHEEECSKPVRRGSFWNSNYIEYEMMIEIKTYQSENIFGKLNPT